MIPKQAVDPRFYFTWFLLAITFSFISFIEFMNKQWTDAI